MKLPLGLRDHGLNWQLLWDEGLSRHDWDTFCRASGTPCLESGCGVEWSRRRVSARGSSRLGCSDAIGLGLEVVRRSCKPTFAKMIVRAPGCFGSPKERVMMNRRDFLFGASAALAAVGAFADTPVVLELQSFKSASF
jgi:hypothetical protein